MRRSNDEAEKNGVSGCAARAYEICRNDGLAMSRLEGVKRAQSRRDERGREQEPEAEVGPRGDEFGKAAARRILGSSERSRSRTGGGKHPRRRFFQFQIGRCCLLRRAFHSS